MPASRAPVPESLGATRSPFDGLRALNSTCHRSRRDRRRDRESRAHSTDRAVRPRMVPRSLLLVLRDTYLLGPPPPAIIDPRLTWCGTTTTPGACSETDHLSNRALFRARLSSEQRHPRRPRRRCEPGATCRRSSPDRGHPTTCSTWVGSAGSGANAPGVPYPYGITVFLWSHPRALALFGSSSGDFPVAPGE